MVCSTLAVSVLLMTAGVNVRAAEDDTDKQQTGLFADFCSDNTGVRARGCGMLYL